MPDRPNPDPLPLLLRAAARAPRPPLPASPPFGLETRVLAAWRQSSHAWVGTFSAETLFAAVFGRATLLAAALALAVAAFAGYQQGFDRSAASSASATPASALAWEQSQGRLADADFDLADIEP